MGNRRGGNGWSVKKLKVFSVEDPAADVGVDVYSSRDPSGSSKWSYLLRV